MTIIIHNTTVVTADAGRRVLYDSAVAIDGDRVVDVGSSGEFSVLVSALNDDVRTVRSNAIDALKEMDKTRAVDPIIDALLEDEEQSVRIHAAEALGEIGGERVVEPLIEALNDEDWLVRAYVVDALGSRPLSGLNVPSHRFLP